MREGDHPGERRRPLGPSGYALRRAYAEAGYERTPEEFAEGVRNAFVAVAEEYGAEEAARVVETVLRLLRERPGEFVRVLREILGRPLEADGA